MFGRSSGKIDLPSVPAALAKVIQITNKPEATAEQVASIVMLDQSLSTKVLRLANSAYLGRRGKAETITQAVVTLGFGSVRNLAASASVIDALFPKQLFPGFSWHEMWTHSVMCALASESLYTRMVGRDGSGESAFVAGLLHDVGKLILARALPHRFLQVVENCQGYGYPMQQAETNVIGVNHAKVGGELGTEWGFPPRLTAGIASHHSPDGANEHEDMARAVQAGNLLAKRMGKNYLIGVPVEVSLKDVADAAELNMVDVEFTVEQVREGLQQSRDLLAWGEKMPDAEAKKAA
jgi:putative nucleotidyltransferase with HDIG domain